MISSSNRNLDVPDSLIKSFFNEGVVAFVGSGPSIDACLPSWHNLLKLMANKIKNYLEKLVFD